MSFLFIILAGLRPHPKFEYRSAAADETIKQNTTVPWIIGLLDCWINGLLQIKELCKNHHVGKIRNAYSEIFLKIQYL